MKNRNWRTTVAGIVLALALVGPELVKLIDEDSATNPNWEIVIAGISGGLLGFSSRDKKVSSKSMGIEG